MRQLETNAINRLKEQVLKRNRNALFIKIPDGIRTGNKRVDVVLDAGRPFYLECKHLESNCLSFKVKSVFKPHQVRSLQRICRLESVKGYIPGWGVLFKGSRVFLVPGFHLNQERLVLADYNSFSLKEVVQFLCDLNVQLTVQIIQK